MKKSAPRPPAQKSARPPAALLIPALTVLLAACGQQAPGGPVNPAGPVNPVNSVSSASSAADSAYAARKQAALAAHAAPGEPLRTVPVTDLATTLPGGQAIRAQAIDKSVPIVLVHGLAGFGSDELLGLNYWGGVRGVQADLRALGYQVFSVSVGPVSSNWDRAAEVYAQLRGGCVDYGAAHAQAAGHTRSDARKCYPGLYPQWSAEHPVNLIGHSMGAPTSRLLVKLLDDGSPENAAGDNLFTGGRHGWVKNVMTISGANTGSPAADSLQDYLPFLKDLLLTLGAAAGTNPVYDFDLGQFGIARQPGESYSQYVNRVLDPTNPVWKSNDQAGHALRVDVAYRENAFIGRSAYTKYFSWATADTSPGLLTGWHYPNVTMFTPFVVTAYPYAWPLPPGLGNLRGSSPEKLVTYDPSWWENDGLVPVRVQHEPLGQQASDYAGQPTQPGHWYRLGKLDGYDHLDITGILTARDVRPFYRNQAAFLSSQN